jgi:hypothetical protein
MDIHSTISIQTMRVHEICESMRGQKNKSSNGKAADSGAIQGGTTRLRRLSLCGSFVAEIEYFMGPELERQFITKATVLYMPRGLEQIYVTCGESTIPCCSAIFS